MHNGVTAILQSPTTILSSRSDIQMKILYLYRWMKCGGGDYHSSRQLTELLERKHRIQYKYAVVPADAYNRSDPADPGYPEWLSDTTFLAQRFDCVILDGPVFASAGLPRIPLETLREFHSGGGSLVLLLDTGEADSMFTVDHDLQLTEFFDAAGHGPGIPLNEDGHIVKGYLHGSSRFRLKMSNFSLGVLPRRVIETVYQRVTTLEVDGPIRLIPFADPLCVGSEHIQSITGDDELSLAPPPFIFANMTTRGTNGRGPTVVLTGLIWNDLIASIPGNDNLRFMDNLVLLLDTVQRENQSYRRMPMVFISYSHADIEIVNKVMVKLQEAGAEVWLDEQQMGVGESISNSCEAGILKADFVVLLMTPHSLNSRWVMWEVETTQKALADIGRPRIIPIVTGVSHEDAIKRVPALNDISYKRLDHLECEVLNAVVRATGLPIG